MSEFTRYDVGTESEQRRKILENIKAVYGFVPELFAYMVESPIAVEAYLNLNKLIAKSTLSPAHQQTALLTVSITNSCGFCTVAHEAMGRGAGMKSQTIEALKDSGIIEDNADRAIATLLVSMIEKRGWVSEEDLEKFYAAGFSKENVFELIVVLSIKTLSNYSNHLTNPAPNEELLQMIEKSKASSS